MRALPEEAVFAAARAVFEHCILSSWDRETRARHWLSEASEYREIARVALSAALPLLDDEEDDAELEDSPRGAPPS